MTNSDSTFVPTDTLVELPLTLAISGRRLVRQAVASALLAGLLGYLYYRYQAWSCFFLALLFAAAAALLFRTSARKMALRITEEGFQLTGGLREKPQTPWQHVTDFGVVNIYGNRFIRYQWTEVSGHRRIPGGVMLAVPGTFADWPLDAVAAMLNVCCQTLGHSPMTSIYSPDIGAP